MSLYEELGGEAAVNAAVDIFYRRVLGDSYVIRFFEGVDMDKQAYLLKQKEDIERLELHESWAGFNLTRTGAFRGQMLCPLLEEHSPARHVMNLANPFHLRVKMFHGDVTDIKATVRAMQSELLDEALMPKELYLSYLTCPVCEEERGGKRMLLLRRWVKSDKLNKRLKKRQGK